MNFKLIFNDRSARREQVCPQGAANLALVRATVHGNSGISLEIDKVCGACAPLCTCAGPQAALSHCLSLKPSLSL